jgi:hypothetical protein
MKSKLKYPFEIFTDGHYNRTSGIASIGVLIADKEKEEVCERRVIDKKEIIMKRYVPKNRIYEIFETQKLKVPSTFMAEATGFFRGMSVIPEFCNEKFSECYEIGRDVVVWSDYQDLVDLMSRKKGNGNIEFLTRRWNGDSNEEEVERLRSFIEDAREITDAYLIKCKKVRGKGYNPAHSLCRKAEARLTQD